MNASMRLALFVSCIACGRAFGGTGPRFVPMPFLPFLDGYLRHNQASGVSGNGAVVVGVIRRTNGKSAAARWQIGAGLEVLPDLPNGGGTSDANDASWDGSVIVGLSQAADGNNRPTRWDNGVISEVPGPEWPFGPWCHAISADASTLVGGTPAWRWTPEEGRVFFTSPEGFPAPQSAHGVSADGSVITGGGSFGFVWTSGVGMEPLGVLAGGVGLSTGEDVSDDGRTIVGSSDWGWGSQAFVRWDGVMVGLGDLPGGLFSSAALCVSGDGSVIAGLGYSTVGSEPFIWTKDLGMVGFRAHLVDTLHLDIDGWNLTYITGLSTHGSVIVGFGINPMGEHQGWAVIAPSPSFCPDVSGDGQVNFVDITSILSTWGTTSPFGDADFNGVVNFADITAVLTGWGSSCL